VHNMLIQLVYRPLWLHTFTILNYSLVPVLSCRYLYFCTNFKYSLTVELCLINLLFINLVISVRILEPRLLDLCQSQSQALKWTLASVLNCEFVYSLMNYLYIKVIFLNIYNFALYAINGTSSTDKYTSLMICIVIRVVNPR
jgi:hypothetical protein